MADSGVTKKISFFFLQKPWSLKKRGLLKQFIYFIFKSEKKKINNLNFIFCSDEYLLKINQEYLNHNDYTDVITFNLSATHSEIVGEIYISLDRVKENAKVFNNPFSKELLRVIFHGLLHLCGYNDKAKSDKEAMKAMEDYYLKKYNDFVSRETRST